MRRKPPLEDPRSVWFWALLLADICAILTLLKLAH
jgi:hypothetical protein